MPQVATSPSPAGAAQALVTKIAAGTNAAVVVEAARQAPHMITVMRSQRQDATRIAGAASTVAEAACRRLVELAGEQLGTAPIAFSFGVTGSLAREELIAGGDQDNVLVLADDYDETAHGDYFQQLGDYVCSHLDECGYTLCPGDVMASNRRWRMTRSEWQASFRQWIEQPEPEALLRLGIFFDLRAVCGDIELVESVRGDFLARCQASPLFQAHLAAAARQFRPALGWFGRLQFRDGASGNLLDLKKHGVTPIIDTARVYALSLGARELGTRARLQRARRDGPLSDTDSESLQAAFERISLLRIDHQCRQIRAGASPDYLLARDELDRTERRELIGALKTTARAQQAMIRQFEAEGFG